MNVIPSQYTHDGTIMMAAAVVERSVDLVQDGWIQGSWVKMLEKKVPVAFCILGAFDQAIEEMMPASSFSEHARREVKEVSIAFVLDEVEEQTRQKADSIPGWNDNGNRTQEEVVKVLQGAAARLWEISLDTSEKLADITKYTSAAAQRGAGIRTDVEPEYLN